MRVNKVTNSLELFAMIKFDIISGQLLKVLGDVCIFYQSDYHIYINVLFIIYLKILTNI